jgi:pectate lyase
MKFCLLFLIISQSLCFAFQGSKFNSFRFENSPIGFASVDTLGNHGTTGGLGGDTIQFNDQSLFQTFLDGRRDDKNTKNFLPKVIIITDTLHGTGQLVAKGVYDLTIIGTGSDALFDGLGLAITNSRNIIVRNIEFRNCKPDGITINTTSSGFTHHIWVDHCTFSDSPEIDPNGSNHDGLLDISHRSSFITISWNHFYNHRKTCLLGFTDGNSEEMGQLKTTYHHNWFEGTYSRHPRVRHTKCHVFNNYYDGSKSSTYGIDYGIASTDGAKVLVEGCYFDKVKNPTKTQEGSSPPGDLLERNNIFIDCGTSASTNIAFDPSKYYSYTLDSASAIPSIIKDGAGSGKLDHITGVKDFSKSKKLPDEFTLEQNYPNPFNPSTKIKYSISNIVGYIRPLHVTLFVYDILGKKVATLVNKAEQPGDYEVEFYAYNLADGVYFYKLSAGNFYQVKKMILLK